MKYYIVFPNLLCTFNHSQQIVWSRIFRCQNYFYLKKIAFLFLFREYKIMYTSSSKRRKIIKKSFASYNFRRSYNDIFQLHQKNRKFPSDTCIWYQRADWILNPASLSIHFTHRNKADSYEKLNLNLNSFLKMSSPSSR